MLKNKLESGFALIESLIAIVVVALGILGILGVQMRTLADTQTGVRRAQAICLIEDLSERLKVNPNALGNIANYEIAAGTPPAPPDCRPLLVARKTSFLQTFASGSATFRRHCLCLTRSFLRSRTKPLPTTTVSWAS